MKNKVNISQIGVGYWGKNLLRNFANHPNVSIVQICDQQASVRKKIAVQYPGISATADFEDLIRNTQTDAIVIATETPKHFELAKRALEAGKHVFVEKPMAQTAKEAEELVRLADERNLRLMVGHLLLYHPAFRYVEDLIKNGTLGDIYYLYSTRVNLGIIRQKENAFESLAPHDLSVALQFFESKPIAISAQGQAFIQPGIHDVVFATIYFESRRMAHLHTSWLDPHKERKVTVVGSKKMAVVDDMSGSEKVRIYDKGVDIKPDGNEKGYVNYAEAMTLRSGEINIPKIDMKEPLGAECDHFVSCVLNGSTPRSDGRNGLAVVRLLEAAQQSLRQQGARVELG